MEKIKYKKKKTQPAWLNDGVRIIGDHQFSEAENGNMLARAHQFTGERNRRLPARRTGRPRRKHPAELEKKTKLCHNLIVTNWNSSPAYAFQNIIEIPDSEQFEERF